MFKQSFRQCAVRWLAIAALLGGGFAMAQSEPSLNQVYEAAQAGRMEQAQQMMQQVLVAHPNSAKAHFVQAELAARQGQMDRARESLATAEKIAPGLSFAKPDAVQSLRSQLAARPAAPAANSIANRPAAPAPASAPFPWSMVLAVGAGVLVLGYFMMRRKPAPALQQAPYGGVPMQQAAYPNPAGPQGGLSGPQGFGAGGGQMQPGYGPGGYGQQPGSGLGGRVMGGLATGLAVGAGVMAAQAIGKSLMGNDEHPAHGADASNAGSHYQPVAGNNDFGGQNFGVNDSGSWDDSNAVASSDGGGDWDS